jgi:hypothetical protein
MRFIKELLTVNVGIALCFLSVGLAGPVKNVSAKDVEAHCNEEIVTDDIEVVVNSMGEVEKARFLSKEHSSKQVPKAVYECFFSLKDVSGVRAFKTVFSGASKQVSQVVSTVQIEEIGK